MWKSDDETPPQRTEASPLFEGNKSSFFSCDCRGPGNRYKAAAVSGVATAATIVGTALSPNLWYIRVPLILGDIALGVLALYLVGSTCMEPPEENDKSFGC